MSAYYIEGRYVESGEECCACHLRTQFSHTLKHGQSMGQYCTACADRHVTRKIGGAPSFAEKILRNKIAKGEQSPAPVTGRWLVDWLR